jgi:hypothetical protein
VAPGWKRSPRETRLAGNGAEYGGLLAVVNGVLPGVASVCLTINSVIGFTSLMKAKKQNRRQAASWLDETSQPATTINVLRQPRLGHGNARRATARNRASASS